MRNIHKNIMESIHQRTIVPRSEWYFVLREIAYWLIVGLLVAIGAMAVALSLHIIIVHDWRSLASTRGGRFTDILLAVPVVWLLLVVLFAYLTNRGFRKTKHGYKVSTTVLIVGIVFASFMIGGVLHAAKVGDALDRSFASYVPYYDSLSGNRRALWSVPDRGRLSGEIMQVTSKGVSLTDFKGVHWEVDIQTAQISRNVILEPGGFVKMRGELNENGVFNAIHVSPWIGPQVGDRAQQAGEMHRLPFEERLPKHQLGSPLR